MSRRKRVYKKEERVDSRYGSPAVERLITTVMKRGKKSLAEKIVYGALDHLTTKGHSDPLAAFKQALDNIRPRVEVKSRRVGGATYQVPVEVPPRRARTLAVRWLVQFSRARREKTMAERLAGELSDAQSEQGAAFKRREDIYRMAQANKAFAHYRW